MNGRRQAEGFAGSHKQKPNTGSAHSWKRCQTERTDNMQQKNQTQGNVLDSLPAECSLFDTGQTFATANAMTKLSPQTILAALSRHISCDWGDSYEEDGRANDIALLEGGRLFSVYHSNTPERTRFYIITEADRNTTTVLLPEEY
jgi:hypothetical protein